MLLVNDLVSNNLNLLRMAFMHLYKCCFRNVALGDYNIVILPS